MKTPIDLHANGKLLISGEYLVLAGARALALPVRFGQTIHVEQLKEPFLFWESFCQGKKWFSANFSMPSFEPENTSDNGISAKLKDILQNACKLNPDFLINNSGYKVAIDADYPLHWGLGSSSTLIYLVAAWMGVDPFILFHTVSAGSGYDIACAGSDQLLFYRLNGKNTEIVAASAGSALRKHSFFAYLGKKQDSQTEVKKFLTETSYTQENIQRISELSSLICNAENAADLVNYIKEHEAIMSTILNKPSVADTFTDFPGTAKSLGAWGGDFAMFVSAENPETIKQLLHKKGFTNIFSYSEIEAFKR
jgi:mevalonate kinase